MMSKITCYLDCVSPYSYFALLALQKYENALQSHVVDIDIVPVFLGGINVGSGNKPPWTLEAKARYSFYDSARAKKYFGVPYVQTPEFFPIVSLLPQRVLVVVKQSHREKFLKTFLNIFEAMWQKGLDVSQPDVLIKVLAELYLDSQVEEIMDAAKDPANKQHLNDNTKEALERGAFGCPWFWVRNSKGEEEPFFGSDRFHFMFEYLSLPWKDLELEVRPTSKL